MDAAIKEAIARLADAGFDLVHAFDAAAAAGEPGWERLAIRTSDPGEPTTTEPVAAAAAGGRVGLLVGNTRALWPRFVAAMRDPRLAAERDPLDRYTESTLAAAFPTAPIFYGHREYGGAFLPFARLAVATGLGSRAASHLVIHPIYGPWFALRAVILVDGEPPVCAPIGSPCTCSAACHTTLSTALASDEWEAWLAVRDACSLRAWRYTDEQVRYHYRKEWIPPIETP